MQSFVLTGLTTAQCDAFALVLMSSGIDHSTVPDEVGWAILVDSRDHLRALKSIESYLEDNKVLPVVEEERPDYGSSLPGSVIAAVGMLIAVHAALISSGWHRALVQNMGSSAEAVLAGELDRCVTALLLHGDVGHLLSNVVGLLVFASAAVAVWGHGMAWILILATGFGGNLINAWAYGQDHLSIGASTAVFGCIGLLAAWQFWRKQVDRRARVKAWLPLAGGLALLSMLGLSQKTDVGAHVFGFAFGIALGLLLGHPRLGPVKKGRQRLLAGLAALTVVVAIALGSLRMA